MRNLIIQRKKSFVACLVSMKVYIEDPLGGDTRIDGVPCRRLGTLKNGQTAAFAIEEEEALVFVVADRLSRGYCNDRYRLPAGTQDIILTGQNRFQVFGGNPFRFDGVTDETVLYQRKKNVRRGAAMLMLALVVGIAVGIAAACLPSLMETRPRTYTDGGMEITLTRAFNPYTDTNFTAYYEAEEVVVFAIRDDPADIPALKDADFGEYAMTILGMYKEAQPTPMIAVGQGKHPAFTCQTRENGVVYTYLVVLYEDNGVFWRVWFGCPTGMYEDMADTFVTWADSVSFRT